MEFYAKARSSMSVADIQNEVTIATLPQWCASVDTVLSQQGEAGEIYCVWGEFRVHRELIGEGVRFTLPKCPNALQWTVTTNAATPGEVVVHATINRQQHDPDFIETLEMFVADWQAGLEARV